MREFEQFVKLREDVKRDVDSAAPIFSQYFYKILFFKKILFNLMVNHEAAVK